MLVYAYEQGGATTAGIVALAQMAPSALFAPFAGTIADRRPAATLALGYAVVAGLAGATAAALLGGAPPAVAYALAVLATTAMALIRPAQAVVAPGVCRTPDELTAFNVVVGWTESAALLVAPLLTGLFLSFASPGGIFAGCAVALVLAWTLVVGLVHEAKPSEAPTVSGTLDDAWAGVAVVARHRNVAMLVGFRLAEYAAWGILDIALVVLALDALDLGDSGVGYLNAALGAGALVGAMTTITLIGRRRLVPAMLLGALLVSVPLVLVGVASTVPAAFALLLVAGAGGTLVDIGARTLLQRVAPTQVLARVFAVSEALTGVAFAVGSVVCAPLVAAGGVQAALAVAGTLLPVLIALRYRALRSIDDEATVPVIETSLLRSMPIFAALPMQTLEGLALRLERAAVPAGTVIIREGEPGDRFYAIADGEVEVSRAGVNLATQSRGEGFGEIALLRDVPRTATVTARTDVLVYTLEREPFVLAVTGHAPAAAAAEEVVLARSAR
jgi:MFS family permease